MANVTVTVRTFDDQATPAPIEDVLVYVFDSSGVAFITSGTTDASGEVQFSLPGDGPGVVYVARLFKAGVAFQPTPTRTLLATDPPAGPDFNLFQFTGHAGISGTVVTFVVQDAEEPPNPVEGTRIRLFSSPGDLYVTELQSDENGEAEIVLEGAADPGKEYIVRVTTPVGYYDGPTKTIAVIDPLPPGETNIFDFTAYPPPAVPVSTDPDMCRLSGFFTDPSLRPLKGLSLIFHPKEGYPTSVISGFPFSGQPTVIRNRAIASERRVNADKNGYVELDLPRTGVFEVFIQGLDAPDHTLLGSVYVPDIAGVNIHDVLFPYLTKVTFAATALALAVGETATLEAALESSNRQPLSGKAVLDALLTYTLSDPAIATVGVNDAGLLQVTGVAAGSTTLQPERVVGTYAPRRPDVPALVIAPSIPTVTVT